MRRVKREITREQYIDAIENKNTAGLYTPQELVGYGVYQERIYEQDGKCYLDFMLGDSCD